MSGSMKQGAVRMGLRGQSAVHCCASLLARWITWLGGPGRPRGRRAGARSRWTGRPPPGRNRGGANGLGATNPVAVLVVPACVGPPRGGCRIGLRAPTWAPRWNRNMTSERGLDAVNLLLILRAGDREPQERLQKYPRRAEFSDHSLDPTEPALPRTGRVARELAAVEASSMLTARSRCWNRGVHWRIATAMTVRKGAL
jgi:hypothetical protein